MSPPRSCNNHGLTVTSELINSTARKPYRTAATSSSSRTTPSSSSSSSQQGKIPDGIDPAVWNTLTASDRRRFAMTGMLPPPPGQGGSTSSRSVASSSTAYSASTSNRPPLQELPSLPEADLMAQMEKKRAMPWEAGGGYVALSHGMSRCSGRGRGSALEIRLADTARPAKKPARTGSVRSNTSAGVPAVNIKQRMVLSDEQKQVLQMVVQDGKSIFFTGSAGTSLSPIRAAILPHC